MTPNLIGQPSPPLEPRASVAELLARVRAGTRVRVFHRDGERRLATSGTVLALAEGWLTLTPLAGGSAVRVAAADISCMYLPPDATS